MMNYTGSVIFCNIVFLLCVCVKIRRVIKLKSQFSTTCRCVVFCSILFRCLQLLLAVVRFLRGLYTALSFKGLYTLPMC